MKNGIVIRDMAAEVGADALAGLARREGGAVRITRLDALADNAALGLLGAPPAPLMDPGAGAHPAPRPSVSVTVAHGALRVEIAGTPPMAFELVGSGVDLRFEESGLALVLVRDERPTG